MRHEPPRDLSLVPCAFCGEPSVVDEVEITPAMKRTKTVRDKDGKPLTAKEIVRPAVKVALCETHHEHHLEQKGWQGRQEAIQRRNTRAAKARLKNTQTTIFDPPTEHAA